MDRGNAWRGGAYCRQAMNAKPSELGRRCAVGAGREQVHARAVTLERANHFLDVNRATLVAEHGDAWVRADIGDTLHVATRASAGRTAQTPASRKIARRRAAVLRISKSASTRRRARVASRTRRAP